VTRSTSIAVQPAIATISSSTGVKASSRPSLTLMVPPRALVAV
jgi:hypothetical protein